jgi:hypothetical protein
MTENALGTKRLTDSVVDEPPSPSLPLSMSLADDTVEVVPPQAQPVPTEDVVKCAKPRCATCFGKGKLTYHAPGDSKAKAKVCECAIRQFVKVHRAQRDLFIDKVGRFYYIPKPEAEIPDAEAETEATKEALPSIAGLSDYNRDRIRGMFARIAQHEADLIEIDARYARMAEPIEVELVAAKNERVEESHKLEGIAAEHAGLVAESTKADAEIEDLAARLFEAKRRKLSLEGEIAASLKKIEQAETLALPGLRKQAGVEQRLDEVVRKRGKARRPDEQKIASLRKRIAHLASLYAVSNDDLAVLAKLPDDDAGDDVADEAALELAAEMETAPEPASGEALEPAGEAAKPAG